MHTFHFSEPFFNRELRDREPRGSAIVSIGRNFNFLLPFLMSSLSVSFTAKSHSVHAEDRDTERYISAVPDVFVLKLLC